MVSSLRQPRHTTLRGTRRLAHVPFERQLTAVRLSVRRYRCSECGMSGGSSLRLRPGRSSPEQHHGRPRGPASVGPARRGSVQRVLKQLESSSTRRVAKARRAFAVESSRLSSTSTISARATARSKRSTVVWNNAAASHSACAPSSTMSRHRTSKEGGFREFRHFGLR